MPSYLAFSPATSPLGCSTTKRHSFAPYRKAVRARPVLLQPATHRSTNSSPEGKDDQAVEDPFAELESYNDTLLDRFFIGYFAKKMSQQLGGVSYEPGYDGFVELSKQIMDGRNSKQQQQAVLGVLDALMPPNAPATFRKIFPFKQWTAELNAAITQRFFAWLVGPLEVQEAEIEYKGEKKTWKSGVQIKKCRYLEQSGCKGMCINMCKIPTQTFFTDTFGLPLTMKPNFEDLSCEMVFGEVPPPIHLDEVYNEPCFTKNCVLADRDPNLPCPKVDTQRKKTLREAGMLDGMKAGLVEGQELGLQKGWEVGQEVGFYAGCVQDERMQSMMEDMRGKFKAVAASLGVLENYFPSQKTSAAESLTF